MHESKLATDHLKWALKDLKDLGVSHGQIASLIISLRSTREYYVDIVGVLEEVYGLNVVD